MNRDRRERLDALTGLICEDTGRTRNPLTLEECLARSECKVNVAHNAAVERPRDHVSSAQRVHNVMTHMRPARDAV